MSVGPLRGATLGKTSDTVARITISGDSTRVKIRMGVRGEGGYGAPGKFKAIYVLRWEDR
jgi:hypothetical protein